jgi:hypothetical protein
MSFETARRCGQDQEQTNEANGVWSTNFQLGLLFPHKKKPN